MASRRTADREPAMEKTGDSQGELVGVTERESLDHPPEAAGELAAGVLGVGGLGAGVLAEKIIDTVREAMLVLDTRLRVVRANDSFYKTFKVSPEETEGRQLYELGNGHWDIPELRRLLDEVLPENNAFSDFEVNSRFETIGRRVMLLNARRVDHIQLVLLAMEDITEHRMAERRRSFLLGLSDGFRGADRSQGILDQAAIGLCDFLPCERTVYLELNVRQGEARILAESPNGHEDGKGTGETCEFGPDLLAAVAKGGDLVIDDVREDSRLRDPAEYDCFGQPGTRALACMVRRRDHGRIGLMVVILTEVHRWRAEELDLLRDVADRSWTALDSALAVAEIDKLNESLERQVSQRTEMLRFLQGVTRSANEAHTVSEAMLAALQRVTEYNGWLLAHVWRLADDNSGQMVSSRVWFTAEKGEGSAARCGEFRQTCSRHRYSPGEGIIGSIMKSGEPKWIDDIANFDDWQRADARALGLQAVIAFPVTVDGKVVAVLEFFSDCVSRRDNRFMEVTPDIGIQLGHVIERKRLEKEIADVTEAEKRRIGSDIHDGVGQELTGLRYMAQTHAESLARQSLPDAQTAERMSESLEIVQQQIRGIIHQLVPVEVDKQGLVAGLRALAERVSEAHDLNCELECEAPILVGDAAVSTQLYRIAQEAVRNTVKHAQATRITIRLTEEEGRLELLVSDDGVGLPATSSHTGVGLRSMAYRAGLIGGTFDIRAEEKAGTRVTCTVLR